MDNKTIGILGGIGVILSLVGGAFKGVGGGAGFILTAVAYYFLGQNYDRKIFSKMLVSWIVPIVAIIVGAIVFFIFFFLEQTAFIILGGILAGLIVYISFIISGKFSYNAHKLITQYTKIDNFRIAGKLYYIGAWLSIILVGFILIFIGMIYACVGFFNLMNLKK